jgi:hypothetical protein
MLSSVNSFLSGLAWWAVAALAIFAWYVAHHGLPWVVGKARSIWSSAVSVEQRVAASVNNLSADFEARVKALEADVAKLKAPAAPAAPANPPTPPAPAPTAAKS